jgi:hypothetical protein
MTATMSIDPASLVRPRRVITGMSAVSAATMLNRVSKYSGKVFATQTGS